MADITNSAITKQEYTAYDGGGLLANTKHVIVVLMPKGMLSAGYSSSGQLTTARYSEYNDRQTKWVTDFYQQQFINEPLLGDVEKIKAVFIAADKYLAVPKSLHNEETATNWLQQVHFVEKDEVVHTASLKEDKVQYLYTVPLLIKELLDRYGKGKIYPLAAALFAKQPAEDMLQCCITPTEVYATLHSNKQLQWHQVFNYANAEDIAYQLKLALQEKGITNAKLQCTTVNGSLHNIANQLTQYFPDMLIGNNSYDVNDETWRGVVHLAQQLYTCA